MSQELGGDVCVIGCGPAGITLERELVAAGASVIALESGGLDHDPSAQSLLGGTATGPVLKGYTRYLDESRRAQVGGAAARWGRGARGWLIPLTALDLQDRPWVQRSGWPLDAHAVAPYAERAAAALEIPPFEAPAGAGGPLVAYSYHFPANPAVLHDDFRRLRRARGFRAELGTCAVAVRDGRVHAVARNREHVTVTARATVLACGGIENARMLLLGSEAPPPALGACFMEHFHVRAGSVSLPDRERWGDYLASGAPRMRVLGLSPAVQRRERLLNATVQLTDDGELFLRAEQVPHPDSRVSLGDERDHLGRRRATLRWEPLAQDWESVVRNAELVAAALRDYHGVQARLAIRVDAPWPWPPADPASSLRPSWGNHHMGTTRMHPEPDDGVVDVDCRVHGTESLFVAGSSVFPTSGFANPTFMIVALAIRLADHLRTLS